jgi:hypothetical protein
MSTDDTNASVIQLRPPTAPVVSVAPLTAGGPEEKVCTRCAADFRARTWHVVWPAERDRPVCPVCALSDPVLRQWQLRASAADAIDRALAETASRDERRLVAQMLVSDVSWFANWRTPDDEVIEWDELTAQPVGEADEDDEVETSPSLTAGDEQQSLRRAAFRAAKMLDRRITEDDDLLGAVEHAYGYGTNHEFATAVMAIVWASEAMA